MAKDVRTQALYDVTDLYTEALTVSGYHLGDNNINIHAGYVEETAAHTAAALRELGIAVHADHARTGVRADWMEQDGPALFIIKETDIYRCETTQRLAL